VTLPSFSLISDVEVTFNYTYSPCVAGFILGVVVLLLTQSSTET